jgi:hypothetical protein
MGMKNGRRFFNAAEDWFTIVPFIWNERMRIRATIYYSYSLFLENILRRQWAALWGAALIALSVAYGSKCGTAPSGLK